MNNRKHSEQILSQEPASLSPKNKNFIQTVQENPTMLGWSFLQTGSTVGAVTLVTWLPDYLHNRIQTNLPIKPVFSLSFLASNSRLIGSGLYNSAKGGFLKSTINSHRKYLVEEVEFSHQEPTEGIKPTEPQTIRKTFEPFVTMLLPFALVDTGATHLYSINRILNDLERANPKFFNADNKFDSSKFWNFYKTGFGFRYTANVINLGCFWGAGVFLIPLAEVYFPAEKYGLKPFIVTTSMSAFVATLLGNGLGAAYKTQVREMNMDTLTSPPALETLYNCAKTQGPRIFTRGLTVGSISMSLVYLTTFAIDAAFRYLSKEPAKSSPQPSSPKSIPIETKEPLKPAEINHKPVEIKKDSALGIDVQTKNLLIGPKIAMQTIEAPKFVNPVPSKTVTDAVLKITKHDPKLFAAIKPGYLTPKKPSQEVVKPNEADTTQAVRRP